MQKYNEFEDFTRVKGRKLTACGLLSLFIGYAFFNICQYRVQLMCILIRIPTYFENRQLKKVLQKFVLWEYLGKIVDETKYHFVVAIKVIAI